MKSNFLSRNRTEGFVTTETAICCCAIILLFSLFITIAGYCRAYHTVKEFIDNKVQDTALTGYVLGFDVPGIILADRFVKMNKHRIKNLIIYRESWGDEVKLKASYTYISLLGNMRVGMSSFFTKWTGDSPEGDKTVWDLPPAQRGKALEALFGGGLPEFFPVLDAYDIISGHAASIVSIDTTLLVYSNGQELKKTIKHKTDELSAFEYGEYEDTRITGRDIDSRELIIIIPENQLNDIQSRMLGECMEYAVEKSITITVKRYQYAKDAVLGQTRD